MKLLRAIDADLARVVMGMVPCDDWKPGNLGSAGGPFMRKDCAHKSCYPRRSNFGDGNGCPRFTTDPAASKALREKLAERFQWSLTREGTSCMMASFRIWTLGAKTQDSYYAEADTEELAVALCACAAFNIEVE